MYKKILGAVALATVMAVGSASAATTSFNFNGNTAPGGPIDFLSADGNLTLTATANNQTSDDGEIGFNNPLLGQYSGGLGVCNGTANSRYSGGCKGDDHQVDGDRGNDVVIFDFGTQEVTLESVTLSFVGSNDQFSFSFFDGNSTTPASFFSSIDPTNGSISTYVFNQVWTGSLFGIGANDSNDEFKIRGLGVSYEVSEIPVPAAAFLFAPALMGFLGLRRKAKQA